MFLDLLFVRIHKDIDNLREVTNLMEQYLKSEAASLEDLVAKEIEVLPSDEEKEYMAGWYGYDFDCLNRDYPIIQRSALFITLMCMTEANLLRACRICHKVFEIPQEFKKKWGVRLIYQAYSYLQEHLEIRDREIKPRWEFLQNLWTIRNALVHNEGEPKPDEINQVSQFCASIPSIELDALNRIILKEGSVQMAIRAVSQFFKLLIYEIARNKLPNHPK